MEVYAGVAASAAPVMTLGLRNSVGLRALYSDVYYSILHNMLYLSVSALSAVFGMAQSGARSCHSPPS